MAHGTDPAESDEYIVPSYCKLPVIGHSSYSQQRYELETLEDEKLIESESPIS